MRRTLLGVGLVLVVVLAACGVGGTPPTPVVRVDDDAVNNTLDAPQVVGPVLGFDQHIRLVGTVSQGPLISDVYKVSFPEDSTFGIAFDCASGANVILDFYSNSQVPIPGGAHACSPDHVIPAISGSGFLLLVSNATIGSIDAGYDLTLELLPAT
jgi:hypothetical protein